MKRTERGKKQVQITVRNRLVKDRRDINVFHRSENTNNLISSKSEGGFPLSDKTSGDYLHISVPSGPGYLLEQCIFDLPSYMNYRFLSQGKFLLLHADERTLLKIPPGPPSWELRLCIPSLDTSATRVSEDRIIISDDRKDFL